MKKIFKILGVIIILLSIGCKPHEHEYVDGHCECGDVKYYNVTFKDYDGTFLGSQTVKHGGEAILPIDPIREGYTFLGWDKDYENVVTDLEIAALYQINQYDITFDSDGGSLVANQKIKFNEKIEEPEDPTKEGYTFLGWYIGEEEYDFNNLVKEDVDLAAKWEINKYTVNFDSDGGSLVDLQTINYGEKAIKPEEPKYEGFVFLGWYIGEEKYDFSNLVKEDVDLIAKWEVATYTVTFVVPFGNYIEPIIVKHGEKINKPDDPTLEEYIFKGWYVGEDRYFFYSEITSDLILTAKWEPEYITNILDAKQAATGHKVILEGKVIGIYQEWDSEHNNMSFIISDDDNNQIPVYRAMGQVTINDIVKIEGTIAYYDGSAQIAQGATVTILEEGEYVDPSLDETASSVLTFDDIEKRTLFTSDIQVWEENGIKFTNTKGKSGNAIGDYSNPIRCYAYTDIKVEYIKEITKVIFVTSGNKTFSTDIVIEGATINIVGSTVTIEFEEPVTSFEIINLPYQIRFSTLTVYSNAE